MLSLIKKIRNYFLVNVLWRRFSFGKNFHAGARVRLWARETLIIGDNFYIGRDSSIETNCIIGHNVIIGNKVGIVGKYDHHYQQIGTPIRLASQVRDEDYNWKGKGLITHISDDVWIGYGATVMQGVSIGEGSIIAAASVVTKDVESYAIYAGNPAKKIADRFNSQADLERHLAKVKDMV